MPLSVLSALSRLGLDPRDEAARLTDLARDAAADQLARTIAQLPGRQWASWETRNIADRLVALLPGAPDRARNGPATGSEPRQAGSWIQGLLICLLLAGAVIASLAASGTLFVGQ